MVEQTILIGNPPIFQAKLDDLLIKLIVNKVLPYKPFEYKIITCTMFARF